MKRIYLCVLATLLSLSSFAATVDPISGGLVVCEGSTTMLADATPGGTWSSGATAVATVGTDGTVTGVVAGTAEITYTVGTDFSTAVVTVNPVPAAIVGLAGICEGASMTVSDPGVGGVWTATGASASTSIIAGGCVITGVTAGTTVITYTLPTGCFVTGTVGVLAAPTAITGTLSVCEGSETTLGNSVPGGTWSTSNAAVATVSFPGIATGLTTGVTDVTYMLPSGCYTTAVLTVNTIPGAITGVTSVCDGGVTMLSNVMAGGSWTSSIITVGTIDAFGSLTGLAVGTTTITYQLSTGCLRTVEITVNPNPAAISGVTSFCGTTTLTDATPGGIWMTSDPSVASVDAFGVVTSYGAGTAIISYVVATGCYVTTTVTPAPSPAAYVLTGGGSYCAGGTGITLVLSGSNTGTNYQLFMGSTMVGSPVPGTGSALSFGSFTTVGTYSVLATNTLSGCTAPMVDTATVAVTAATTPIGGTLAFCTGSAVVVTDATVGGTWSTAATNITIGSSSGTVVGLSAGTATITYSAGTCGDVYETVTVNALPAVITGNAAICATGAGGTVTLSNATTGGTWSSVDASVVTVGASTGILSGVTGGNATISYLLPTGCGSSVVATVNGTPFISGPSNICTGDVVTMSTGGSSGTWSSFSTNATVSSTGVVTGVSAGSTVIQFTNTCGSAGKIVHIAGTSGTDLAINVMTQAGRHSYQATITVTNLLCSPSAPTLTFHHSPKYTYLMYATGTPTVTGNDITWTLPYISSGGSQTVTVWLERTGSISSWLMPGDTALNYFRVDPTISDVDSSNNIITKIDTVRSSFDPNAIAVAPEGYILPCQDLTYTIQFENDGNDTARDIYVLDTLASSLDPTSISMVTTSHPGVLSVINSGGYNIARFDFANINLPDSSHHGEADGMIVFTIRANTAIADGTTIPARAGIYFDDNPVVMTNEVSNTAGIAPITGLNAVCAGSSVTLANTVAGGTWSAANSRATVIDGVVTGSIGGIDTINYTVSNVCASRTATMQVTVRTVPDINPILAPAGVCLGSTTTLATTTTGGLWSSSNSFTAPVNALSGVVAGSAVGAVVISYTLGNDCGDSVATVPLIVDPMPFAGTISGAGIVCVGSTITLYPSLMGGAWSSGGTSLAVVGSTGIVSGVSAGTVDISYEVANTCSTAVVTQSVYVNPLPVAGTITGPSAVCIGYSSPFAASISGGSWSSVGSSVSVTSAGVVSGVSVGAGTIYYTVSNLCGSDAALMPVVVDPLPNAGTIVVPSMPCPGHSVMLSNSVTGGVWSSGTTSVATISSSGVVAATTPGTSTISYAVSNSCGTALATSVLTVDAIPVATPITGATAVCSGATVTLTNATPGGVWGGSMAGIANVNAGTGVVTGLGGGTATVSYTLTNLCGTATATANVTVSNTYIPFILITATPNTIISAGQTATLSATVSGAGPAPDFQWLRNGVPIAGATTGVYVSSSFADGDSITCKVTGSGSCGQVSSTSVIMKVVSGIATVNAAGNMSVYPNPSTGTLFITGAAEVDETISVNIINVLGQVVYATTAEAKNGAINARIQLPETLANGSYMLSCQLAGTHTVAQFVLRR